MTSAPPTSALKRSAITGIALAHAGVSHLGHKAKQSLRSPEKKALAQEEHDAELGRILFKALNQLKGCALKVSQILSMEAEFLPPAARRELAQACYQVTPLNRALVLKQFQQEFNSLPQDLFAHFQSSSFAAASLGQVHRARSKTGQELAVKIQYPGIASAIQSDMRLLRQILRAYSLGRDNLPSPAVMDRVLGEIEAKLNEELDYEHEAQQIDWFHQQVRASQSLAKHIVIPQVVTDFSSKRILSMEMLEGMHLDAWLATNPRQEQRNHFGQILFDWFWSSLFQLHRLHADPHPGNFLFMPDQRLGVLDFGCTQAISDDFPARIARHWTALMMNDLDETKAIALRASYLELAFFPQELNQQEFNQKILPALAPLHQWKIEAFQVREFDFGHKSPYPIHQDARQHKQLRAWFVGYHPDIPYFDRAFLGLMHMLKKIGARVHTRILN